MSFGQIRWLMRRDLTSCADWTIERGARLRPSVRDSEVETWIREYA